MMAMPIAEIYALLAGLLAVGVLWLVARFNDRDWPGLEATST